jgi:hypothetical protein
MYARLRGLTPRLFAVLPLPLVLTLNDGDFGKTGVYLSTALPATIENECHQLDFAEQREDEKISVQLKGVTTVKALTFCKMAKEPAPIESEMANLTQPGTYRIDFSKPGQEDHDSYRIEVSDTQVTFEPRGTPAFTQAANAGTFQRVPEDWLTVDFKFMDAASFSKLSKIRTQILQEFEKMGARMFEPHAGVYLFGNQQRKLPAKNPTPEKNGWIDETFHFHWKGDWKLVDDLMKKYAKLTEAEYAKPYVGVWAHTRDRVSSTYMHAH